MDASIKLDPRPNGGWHISNGHLVLHKNTGAHVITFDIVDTDNGGIVFSDDPIWIQSGSKPHQPPAKGTDNGQIGAVKLMNGKQLVILDWNDVPGQLYYQLNFKNYPALDPIIDNGGGIKPPSAAFSIADYLGYAALAIAAFLVGMLAYRMFFARKAAPRSGAGARH